MWELLIFPHFTTHTLFMFIYMVNEETGGHQISWPWVRRPWINQSRLFHSHETTCKQAINVVDVRDVFLGTNSFQNHVSEDLLPVTIQKRHGVTCLRPELSEFVRFTSVIGATVPSTRTLRY